MGVVDECEQHKTASPTVLLCRFFAPSGAQGVEICVCPFGTSLAQALILQLSGSDL